MSSLATTLNPARLCYGTKRVSSAPPITTIQLNETTINAELLLPVRTPLPEKAAGRSSTRYRYIYASCPAASVRIPRAEIAAHFG